MRSNLGVAADPPHNKDDAIALRPRVAGSSFFWATQLMSYERREAMYALYPVMKSMTSTTAMRRVNQEGPDQQDFRMRAFRNVPVLLQKACWRSDPHGTGCAPSQPENNTGRNRWFA